MYLCLFVDILCLPVTCGRSDVFSGYSDNTDHQDITEILLTVALNVMTLTLVLDKYCTLHRFIMHHNEMR